jgi:hypothetical protein
MVISISADVWALITNQNLFVRTSSQAFGKHAAGEARPYY